MASGVPGTFVLLFLIGFLIVVAGAAAIRKRPGWGVVMAVITFVVAGLVVVRYLRLQESNPERRSSLRAHRSHAEIKHAEPALLNVEKPDLAARRIEAPDDVKVWARDGVLGDFRPPCPWLSEAGSGRIETLIGDTEFLYWEPVNGRLHGFSEQEPEAEAAFKGARGSAARKLAVLALLLLEREDPRVDAAAAEPLASRLARQFIREEERHLEKAGRPYGDVYRAAVRAHAGSNDVNGLAAAVREELDRGWVKKQRAMASWLVAIGASLVIGFAVFLFYTFANAGTKGYFAWPLRLASLALFILLCAGLFYLRVRLGMG